MKLGLTVILQYHVVELCQHLGKLVQEFYRSGHSNTVASRDFASEQLSFFLFHRQVVPLVL